MRTRSWKEYEEADHLCSWEAQDYSEKPWDTEQRLRRMRVILRSLVAAISRRMPAEQIGIYKGATSLSKQSKGAAARLGDVEIWCTGGAENGRLAAGRIASMTPSDQDR